MPSQMSHYLQRAEALIRKQKHPEKRLIFNQFLEKNICYKVS